MSGQLIFNADDYGLSPAVSAGIRLAMTSGVVRSTTTMANLVTDDEVKTLAELLAEHQDRTAGAHLNLSCGPPLSGDYPASLCNEKGMSKALALDAATWQDAAQRQAAAAEWEAQLVALQATGLPLSHIDSHHHVHLLPPLFPIALDLAQRHGLALRTRREFRSLARNSGVATPDSLLEGYFGAEHISKVQLLALLADADEGWVEVMCHPGQVDDLLAQRSGYVQERETELSLLGDAGLGLELERAGWRLSGYRLDAGQAA